MESDSRYRFAASAKTAVSLGHGPGHANLRLGVEQRPRVSDVLHQLHSMCVAMLGELSRRGSDIRGFYQGGGGLHVRVGSNSGRL